MHTCTVSYEGNKLVGIFQIMAATNKYPPEDRNLSQQNNASRINYAASQTK